MANKAKVDVQALAKIDLGQSDDSAALMNCWCCSGAAPLLALPAYAAVHNPPTLFAGLLPPPADYQPTPRQLWPALNPRASPLA